MSAVEVRVNTPTLPEWQFAGFPFIGPRQLTGSSRTKLTDDCSVGVEMRRLGLYGSALWAAGLASIIVAGWLSVSGAVDRNLLPQAGCFLVVLGVWSGFGGALLEQLEGRRLQFQRRLDGARIGVQYARDREMRRRLRSRLDERLKERLKEVTDQWRISVGALEASFLLVGTPLWGFGEFIPI